MITVTIAAGSYYKSYGQNNYRLQYRKTRIFHKRFDCVDTLVKFIFDHFQNTGFSYPLLKKELTKDQYISLIKKLGALQRVSRLKEM